MVSWICQIFFSPASWPVCAGPRATAWTISSPQELKQHSSWKGPTVVMVLPSSSCTCTCKTEVGFPSDLFTSSPWSCKKNHMVHTVSPEQALQEDAFFWQLTLAGIAASGVAPIFHPGQYFIDVFKQCHGFIRRFFTSRVVGPWGRKEISCILT